MRNYKKSNYYLCYLDNTNSNSFNESHLNIKKEENETFNVWTIIYDIFTILVIWLLLIIMILNK